MHNYTQFEELIFSFCQRYQIGMIEPDQQLRYVLYVDDMEAKCFLANQEIYLLVELGGFGGSSPDKKQLLLEQLLQNPLVSCADSNCILSLNEDNILCLYQRLPTDSCNLTGFEESRADLASRAEVFTEVLNEAR